MSAHLKDYLALHEIGPQLKSASGQAKIYFDINTGKLKVAQGYGSFGDFLTSDRSAIPLVNDGYSLGSAQRMWADGYFGGSIIADGYLQSHSFFQAKEVSGTPSTPPLGYSKLYPKTDGYWYQLLDTGEEIQVGAGGGGGGGGGTVDGTGAANQIPYWVDSNTLTGSANMLFDATNGTITLDGVERGIVLNTAGSLSRLVHDGTNMYLHNNNGPLEINTSDALTFNVATSEFHSIQEAFTVQSTQDISLQSTTGSIYAYSSAADVYVYTEGTNADTYLYSQDRDVYVYGGNDAHFYASGSSGTGNVYLDAFGAGSTVFINTDPSGSAGAHVKISGSTDGYLFFADGANNRIGFGTGSPQVGIHYTKNANDASARVRFENTNAGTSARVLYELLNDVGGGLQLNQFSSGFTTSGPEKTNSSFVHANNDSDGTLEIGNTNDSGPQIGFWTRQAAGSFIERARFKTSEFVINDSSEDYDFRVEGNGDANLIFADAGNDRVGIGTASPGTKLHVQGSYPQVRIDSSSATADVGMALTNNSGATWRGGFIYDSSSNNCTSFYGPLASAAGSIHILNTGDVTFTIDSAGVNGGGATTPAVLFNGTSDATAGTWIHNHHKGSTSDFIVHGDSVDNLYFADVSADTNNFNGRVIHTNNSGAAAHAWNTIGTVGDGGFALFRIDAATNGAGASGRVAFQTMITAGTTTSGPTVSIDAENANTTNGNDFRFGTSSVNPTANSGINGFAYGSNTGINIGSFAEAAAANTNVGVVGKSITAKNSATNIAVLGIARNTGTSPIEIGGYFGLHTSTPTFASAALVADNGSTTQDILILRDQGVDIVNVKDSTSGTVFNENGADRDFRVEGDTNADLFFIDASTDRVGIGTSAPSVLLDVAGDFNVDGYTTLGDGYGDGLTINGYTQKTVYGLAYASSISINFAQASLQNLILAGNVTFGTVNLAPGRSTTIRIVADGSSRTLTFPSWRFIGSAAPTSIAASKVAILSLVSWGTTNADVVAAYSVES